MFCCRRPDRKSAKENYRKKTLQTSTNKRLTGFSYSSDSFVRVCTCNIWSIISKLGVYFRSSRKNPSNTKRGGELFRSVHRVSIVYKLFLRNVLFLEPVRLSFLLTLQSQISSKDFLTDAECFQLVVLILVSRPSRSISRILTTGWTGH